MCYFLYGAVNGGINEADYARVDKSCGYYFPIGEKEDVNNCVEKCGNDFRIKKSQCDCDTAVGKHKTGKEELKGLSQMLDEMRSVRGIKHIYMSKNWAKETNSREICVHIQDIDAVKYLADMKENCLYKIGLYKKYD
jgi:hypothetical protein